MSAALVQKDDGWKIQVKLSLGPVNKYLEHTLGLLRIWAYAALRGLRLASFPNT